LTTNLPRIFLVACDRANLSPPIVAHVAVLSWLLAVALAYLNSALLNKTVSFALYSSARPNAIAMLVMNEMLKSLENRQHCK
jgi:hypothetical protein